MSYQTTGYSVDLDKLAAVKGCHDEAFLAEVLKNCADRIKSHDEWSPAEPERGVVSIHKALQDIINAELDDLAPQTAFQYLYALEVLCLHLGTRLDGGGCIRDIEDVCWDTRLAELMPPPLGLPCPQDFPSVSYLTASQVKEECERFDDDDSESLYELGQETADAREDFLWWLKQCADRGLALMTFCY
jgi:hypothetical protein